MNAGAKIGKFLKRHWLTGYVAMLNGFVYDAYWAEKIECAFGLLDQLQPKELSFYAISILILLLHLPPLLFVRSRYLCAFGWGAVRYPFYGFFPAICLVSALFLLLLGVRRGQYRTLFKEA